MGFLINKTNDLIRHNPFNDLERMHRHMNHLLDFTFPGLGGHDTSLLEGYWVPAIDVHDKTNEIIVTADLPGLSKDDIDIVIENNVLTIRGEKKYDASNKEGEAIRMERYYGSFYRAFTLPASVDANKVNAKFNNGVLELTIAKKEEARQKQIKIDVK